MLGCNLLEGGLEQRTARCSGEIGGLVFSEVNQMNQATFFMDYGVSTPFLIAHYFTDHLTVCSISFQLVAQWILEPTNYFTHGAVRQQ